MSNPTITRLGKTQFWYKKYYSDFSYTSTYKKYSTFETLLNNYFTYGIFLKNNILMHKFFYKNYVNNNNLQPKNINSSLYFRKYYYAHSTLTIEHSYSLRLKTPEFFALRLYILKYNNWIVLSIQWFKPLKNTIKSKNLLNIKKSRPVLTSTKINSTKKLKRTSLLILFLKKVLVNSSYKLKYTF